MTQILGRKDFQRKLPSIHQAIHRSERRCSPHCRKEANKCSHTGNWKTCYPCQGTESRVQMLLLMLFYTARHRRSPHTTNIDIPVSPCDSRQAPRCSLRRATILVLILPGCSLDETSVSWFELPMNLSRTISNIKPSHHSMPYLRVNFPI
jgi:hypothetical protein